MQRQLRLHERIVVSLVGSGVHRRWQHRPQTLRALAPHRALQKHAPFA